MTACFWGFLERWHLGGLMGIIPTIFTLNYLNTSNSQDLWDERYIYLHLVDFVW